MASRLTPCPSCSRHVKVGPPSCPFCGGAVPTDVPARTFAVPAGKPLTRAAILFAGAAAVTACSPSSSGPTESKDAEADHGHAVAAYGVAVIPDGGQEGFPDGGVSALYGVMAIPDSGEEGFPDGGVMAAYGVAVIPDGGKK